MTEQHETYPNALEALLLIVVLMVIELFVSAAVFDADLLAGINDGDVSGFITVVGNGILFVGLMAYKRIGYRALFHPARHSPASTMALVTAPILLLVPGLVLLAGAINSIVVWLFPMSTDDITRFDTQMVPGLVPALFSCVAAPVLEEMLFRGVILRGFLRQYSRTFAILWSAALFGIAHMNIYQLATAFAIGIVAGWLYERCRSLWPCILLHAAYNGFVTYYYVWLVGQPEAEAMSAGPTGAAFVAAIIGGLLLLKLLHGGRRQAARPNSSGA
jgi:membrane protease YdiL (CAAX protease family)